MVSGAKATDFVEPELSDLVQSGRGQVGTHGQGGVRRPQAHHLVDVLHRHGLVELLSRSGRSHTCRPSAGEPRSRNQSSSRCRPRTQRPRPRAVHRRSGASAWRLPPSGLPRSAVPRMLPSRHAHPSRGQKVEGAASPCLPCQHGIASRRSTGCVGAVLADLLRERGDADRLLDPACESGGLEPVARFPPAKGHSTRRPGSRPSARRCRASERRPHRRCPGAEDP